MVKIGGIDSHKDGKLIWCAKHGGFVPEDKVKLDHQGYTICDICRRKKKK